MQYDLFWSGYDSDLRSNLSNDILRSNYSSFDASRQEKDYVGNMNAASVKSEVITEIRFFFVRTAIFKVIYSLEAKQLILGQVWGLT